VLATLAPFCDKFEPIPEVNSIRQALMRYLLGTNIVGRACRQPTGGGRAEC
jgi:hypothetical protein